MASTVSPKDPTDIDRQVGHRIAALRKAKGLSQTSLALALGVSAQQVQKYEIGQNRLSVARLLIAAESLDVPVAALLDEERPTGSGPLFDLLALPGAAELLRTYAALGAPSRREALLIVRSLARAVQARDESSAEAMDRG